MSRRLAGFGGSGARALHHRVGAKRELAGRPLRHPVAQGGNVLSRLGADLARLLERGGDVGIQALAHRRVFLKVLIEPSGKATSGGRTIVPVSSIQTPLGTFTTPKRASMRCAWSMSAGMGRFGPGYVPGRLLRDEVEGDANHLEAAGPELLTQRLPPGQVIAAASPRSPGEGSTFRPPGRGGRMCCSPPAGPRGGGGGGGGGGPPRPPPAIEPRDAPPTPAPGGGGAGGRRRRPGPRPPPRRGGGPPTPPAGLSPRPTGPPRGNGPAGGGGGREAQATASGAAYTPPGGNPRR